MRHMDEGLLQAWLDGPRAGLTEGERAEVRAHLDECPVCRERVDTLRAAGERTKALLAVAEEQDDDIPDFAAVVQRAKELSGESAVPMPSPEATPRARPWFARRTAWAASVIVALGAGWLANEWNASAPMVRLDPLQVTESPAPVGSAVDSVLADASAVPVETPSPTSGAGAEAGAAAERRVAAEAPRAREAEAQASALAPPPVEGDPVLQFNAIPVPERTLVSGRVVDAASGRPLESVQVFVPGTNAGTLTNADGRFLLFPGPSQDSAAQLRVAILGYRQAELTVELTGNEVALGDVALSQATLALDQLVVAGTMDSEDSPPSGSFAAVVPTELSDDRWSPAPMDEAEAYLGASPGTVPDLPVAAVHIGSFDGLSVIRVEQELGAGGLLTLLQARTQVAPGDRDLGATTELPGGVFVRGWADVSPDSLRALVERVRAN